jgi:hypothetical protein
MRTSRLRETWGGLSKTTCSHLSEYGSVCMKLVGVERMCESLLYTVVNMWVFSIVNNHR